MQNKRIELKTRDGKVILEVEGQDEFLVVDPGLALELGRSMIDAALSLSGIEVAVVPQRKDVTPLQRASMVIRCDHVMRTMQQKPRKIVAVHVVDTILAML